MLKLTVKEIMRICKVTREKARKILENDKKNTAAFKKRQEKGRRFSKRRAEFYKKQGLPENTYIDFSKGKIYPHAAIKLMGFMITRFKFIFVKSKRDAVYKGSCNEIFIYLSGPLRDKKGVITEQSRREILDQTSVWCIESVHRVCVAFADKDYCYIDEQGKQTPSEVYPVAYLKISDKQISDIKKRSKSR